MSKVESSLPFGASLEDYKRRVGGNNVIKDYLNGITNTKPQEDRPTVNESALPHNATAYVYTAADMAVKDNEIAALKRELVAANAGLDNLRSIIKGLCDASRKTDAEHASALDLAVVAEREAILILLGESKSRFVLALNGNLPSITIEEAGVTLGALSALESAIRARGEGTQEKRCDNENAQSNSVAIDTCNSVHSLGSASGMASPNGQNEEGCTADTQGSESLGMVRVGDTIAIGSPSSTGSSTQGFVDLAITEKLGGKQSFSHLRSPDSSFSPSLLLKDAPVLRSIVGTETMDLPVTVGTDDSHYEDRSIMVNGVIYGFNDTYGIYRDSQEIHDKGEGWDTAFALPVTPYLTEHGWKWGEVRVESAPWIKSVNFIRGNETLHYGLETATWGLSVDDLFQGIFSSNESLSVG